MPPIGITRKPVAGMPEIKHQATTQKVQRILVDGFNDVRLRKSGGFVLDVGSSAAFVEIHEWTPDSEGNARSVFEGAYANMASRALADGRIDRSEVDKITVDDLPTEDPFTTAQHRIGFRPR